MELSIIPIHIILYINLRREFIMYNESHAEIYVYQHSVMLEMYMLQYCSPAISLYLFSVRLGLKLFPPGAN